MYLIYCKFPDQKRYAPIGTDDEGFVCQVKNLIYACVFDTESQAKIALEKLIEGQNSSNILFKIVKK